MPPMDPEPRQQIADAFHSHGLNSWLSGQLAGLLAAGSSRRPTARCFPGGARCSPARPTPRPGHRPGRTATRDRDPRHSSAGGRSPRLGRTEERAKQTPELLRKLPWCRRAQTNSGDSSVPSPESVCSLGMRAFHRAAVVEVDLLRVVECVVAPRLPAEEGEEVRVEPIIGVEDADQVAIAGPDAEVAGDGHRAAGSG